MLSDRDGKLGNVIFLNLCGKHISDKRHRSGPTPLVLTKTAGLDTRTDRKNQHARIAWRRDVIGQGCASSGTVHQAGHQQR
jgi:hypothetical protein